MGILFACLFTVIIESAFFYFFCEKETCNLIIIVLSNIISNLLLNLIILFVFNGNPGFWIVPMEFAVVFFEYFIFSISFHNKHNLFLKTFLANCLSYSTGFVIQFVFRS